jgi:tRNA pseudouridine38-40 synthase
LNNFRLTIQYDGGRYKGWQRLGGGENTIQGKLEAVLSELTGENTEVVGCGRTDAGVHALAQTANFKTGKSLTTSEIKACCNKYLPQDISVTEVFNVPENFHSRYHAVSKTYLYRIWNREYPNPFLRRYSMHVENKLDIDAIKKAAGYFVGEHDFTAFSNAKSKKKSMVREIYSIDISEKEGLIDIRIKGNGFLYNMVRKIIGTLLEVGAGNTEAESVPEILSMKERSRTGSLADACGLYLEKIEY